MNVEYRKLFLKELAKLPSSYRIDIEKFVFVELPSLKSLSDSKKIERFQPRFGHEMVHDR